MLIPPEILECVAFTYCKIGKEHKPAGTVFFINLRDPDNPRKGWQYAITAQHVINGIKQHSEDNKVYFRLNRKGGNANLIETKLEDWIFHPSDPTVDVAVLNWTPPFEEYDVRVFQSDGFAKDAVDSVQDHGVIAPGNQINVPIGIGDDLFIAGLFRERLGESRNIPIIRIGNIAAMAGEPIKTQFADKMVVHLIECRSIGGLSGSPVFVHLGRIRKVNDRIVFSTGDSGVFHLFGLIHGHWDEEITTQSTILKEKVNMGIAMVVPMEKILEVLNQPKLVELRQREKEEANT